MNDRELLEAAAKAAGYPIHSDAWACGPSGKEPTLFMGNSGPAWNPLTNDGDALRLAVKLGLAPSVFVVGASDGCTMVSSTTLPHGELFVEEMHEQDPYAATRRAIVRAAAEIAC